jgi:hypothetical protein
MITIRRPPSPPDQVFALATPAHLLSKLSWELRQLRKALASKSDDVWENHVRAYHAFNFAVTAWHLTDWVWATAPDDLKRQISDSLGQCSNLSEFKQALARRARAIRICQQIANGSKHMILSYPDPTVRVEVVSQYVPPLAGTMQAGDPLGKYELHLMIWDKHVQRSAVDVFDEAFQNWCDFLAEWGFIEGRLVLGDPKLDHTGL